MPKAYRVSPVLRPGKTYYVATFRNARGERVCRGLGTAEHAAATVLCGHLAGLWTRGIRSAADSPVDVPLDALKLFFGESEAIDVIPTELVALEKIESTLADLPDEIYQRVAPIVVDRARLKHENETQRLMIATLKRDLDFETTKRREIERSIIGRAAAASSKVPTLDKAIVDFESHLKSHVAPETQRYVLQIAKNFLATLAPERRTSLDITGEEIEQFIEQHVATGDPTQQSTRRDAMRRRLGRFINWAAGRWEYPTQMLHVKRVPKTQIDRERGDIHWHTLDEVETVITGLEDESWKATVAMLAYAGLQLAELCWLRPADITIEGNRGAVWVTTVVDADDPAAKHLLKSGHRRRKVDIHPTYLLPRVRDQLTRATPNCLFPMKEHTRRRKREINKGATERWIVGTLGRNLRGDVGGKTRAPLVGILPPGMTAKSLRRTFGSLLLRSGKSSAEVAAAMGNTEDVVRRHYARILGCEVDVNF